jgi:hypothetical protein
MYNSKTGEGDHYLKTQDQCVSIGTISGGIVNFGGALYISPISITKTISGSENSNSSQENTDGESDNGSDL